MADSASAIWLSGCFAKNAAAALRAASGCSVARSNSHLVASRQARSRPGSCWQQLIDVLQAGEVLLAFDHAVDLLQLGRKSPQQNLIFLPVPPGQSE